MRYRLQITLGKMLLTVAALSIVLGASTHLGGGAQLTGVALILGTAISGLILQSNAGNRYQAAESAFWILLGALVGMATISPELAFFRTNPQQDVFPSNIVNRNAVLIGATIGIGGGAVVSRILQRLRKPPMAPPP